MKNIHVISSRKPSRLILQTNGKLRISDIILRGQVASGVTQNIYITNDEEIKGEDWCLDIELNMVHNNLAITSNSKKIILTTDQDLINDGVQAINDEFLEWFVKNPSCEEVKVEGHIYKGQDETEYKIIIPKECMITKIMQMDAKMAYDSLPKQEILLEDVFNEEKNKGVKELIDKQETLEEETIEEYYLSSIKNVLQFNNDAQAIRLMEKYFEQKCWIEGRSYSEEDMVESFMACWKANVPEGFECKLSFNEWFNKFKKK